MISKLHGLTKEEFYQLKKEKQLSFKVARLIPLDKPGDEMALTSVFMSTLRLVKEFRNKILSDLRISQKGEIVYLTEFGIKDFPNCRFDGIIIVFKSNKITDVAVFEMKNGNSILDKEQMERYFSLCRDLRIEKLVSVSNQFVSDVSHCPVGVKSLKSLKRYHLSWTYILTIGQLLLFKNDKNINDDDQAEIMKEALSYFENKKSGIVGKSSMKKEWVNLSEQITLGTTIKSKSEDLEGTVLSWIQEEQDLGLFLSRKLGVMVDVNNSKYKNNMKKQLDDYKKQLLDKKTLDSSLRIKGVVSNLNIIADFSKRAIEFNVSLNVGNDSSRKKISWLKKQFELCLKRSDDFLNIESNVFVDILFKNSNKSERISLGQLRNLQNEYNHRDIREFKVVFIKDYGKLFLANFKFITSLEMDSLEFYRMVVQNLKKWEVKVPLVKIENNQLECVGVVPINE